MWQTFVELSSWLLGPLGWIAVGWFLAGVLVASAGFIRQWMPIVHAPVYRAVGIFAIAGSRSYALRMVDAAIERRQCVVVEFPSPESDEIFVRWVEGGE